LQLERVDRVALRLLARVFGGMAIFNGHTHDNLDRRVNHVRLFGTGDATVPDPSGLVSYKQYTFYRDSEILRAQIRRVRAV